MGGYLLKKWHKLQKLSKLSNHPKKSMGAEQSTNTDNQLPTIFQQLADCLEMIRRHSSSPTRIKSLHVEILSILSRAQIALQCSESLIGSNSSPNLASDLLLVKHILDLSGGSETSVLTANLMAIITATTNLSPAPGQNDDVDENEDENNDREEGDDGGKLTMGSKPLIETLFECLRVASPEIQLSALSILAHLFQIHGRLCSGGMYHQVIVNVEQAKPSTRFLLLFNYLFFTIIYLILNIVFICTNFIENLYNTFTFFSGDENISGKIYIV